VHPNIFQVQELDDLEWCLNQDPDTLYLDNNILIQRLSFLAKTHHSSFANEAKFSSQNVLNPNPPSNSGVHNFDQAKGKKY
jgi:hypothetical protein